MLSPMIFALNTAAGGASVEPTPRPIACRPHALDQAQRERQRALLAEVSGQAKGTDELPDGIALRFPAEDAVFLKVAEWISLERRCCAFLDFALEWRAEGVRVRLTGPEGVKELIAAEMGLARAR
jgi:hypothetical protein